MSFIYENKYPALSNFFGAYYNQDWKYCYDWDGQEPDWRVVVYHFREVNPEDFILQAVKELEMLLTEKLTDQELKNIINDQFSSAIYAPGLGFINYRSWCEEILKILKTPS